ncbi:hypothetical protein NX059_000942 [Plenodomus lindquistii]|nr:hypothetical protein NX059_000942 [Plenodomus lindquistii]
MSDFRAYIAPIDGPNGPSLDRDTTLGTAMTASAFLGVALYLCAELQLRLLLRSTRRSLYFWACLVCSWGIFVHSICITLSDFRVWGNYSSFVFIFLSWFTFVVGQSVVLYSRLSLVLLHAKTKRYVLYMIITTAIIFGFGTVIINLISHYPHTANLERLVPIWEKIQLAAFFLQETSIGLLYIRATAAHLRSSTILGTPTAHLRIRRALRNLIAVNIFIIFLDFSVIGMCYTGFFFLQSFHKVAVYAIKLRAEFTILNQLRASLPRTEEHVGFAELKDRLVRAEQGVEGRGSEERHMEMLTTKVRNVGCGLHWPRR